MATFPTLKIGPTTGGEIGLFVQKGYAYTLTAVNVITGSTPVSVALTITLNHECKDATIAPVAAGSSLTYKIMDSPASLNL
jgi:hypothetical protein